MIFTTLHFHSLVFTVITTQRIQYCPRYENINSLQYKEFNIARVCKYKFNDFHYHALSFTCIHWHYNTNNSILPKVLKYKFNEFQYHYIAQGMRIEIQLKNKEFNIAFTFIHLYSLALQHK